MKYIMSLDQGTTSSRCIIFNEKAEIISVAQKEITQHYPCPGWVEHDPYEILNTQIEVAKLALSKASLNAKDIHSIGITNQRETTIVWNKHTGIPYGNAIVWQCRRTADYCTELINAGYEDIIKSSTGLLIDPYFSATKIRWILDNVEGAREAAENGDAIFGTVDTWLIWNISGKKAHVTDPSNASRTMLFNIKKMEWDKDILKLLDIPESMLPTIVDNAGSICKTSAEIFGEEVLISGVAGDQQAALFGQGCFVKGDCKNTYGTGCFLLMNTGNSPVFSNNGLLTTVAWRINGETTYAKEGSVFIGGAAVQWLRDEMKFIKSAADSEAVALEVSNCGGVYVVPAFTGLGAPIWDPDARGIITGITRGTNFKHIVRATLESIAFQVEDILQLMIEEAECNVTNLAVDGGASMNEFLMQFQSDISNVQVIRRSCVETTALGVALLAGLGSGIFSSLSDICNIIKSEKLYTPKIQQNERESLLCGWHKALEKCKH